eukprot:COSAG01_NODE_67706_length_266_cov_0.622754_1_plen_25_part_10
MGVRLDSLDRNVSENIYCIAYCIHF